MRGMLLGSGEKLFCYKVTDKLSELCSCPSVLWNVGRVSNTIEYLANHSVKDIAWLFLNGYGKMREERTDFKMELSIKREAEI